MLKSFWLAQELLTTFEEDLDAATVLSSSSKGVFAVKFNGNDLLWDRSKEQGGFPSPKGLKQIVTPNDLSRLVERRAWLFDVSFGRIHWKFFVERDLDEYKAYDHDSCTRF